MNFNVTLDGTLGGEPRKLEVVRADGGWRIRCDGRELAVEVAEPGPATLSLLLGGRSFSFAWARAADGAVWLAGAGRGASLTVADPCQAPAQRRFEQSGRARIAAPMAGKVVRLLADPGAQVAAGQPLLVLEAMKMQNEVRSPKAGTLVKIAVAAGETVATGQVLAEVE
ncbi:MAG: biotin/lipoyl-containing protein [Terriglobales bacterium]